MKQQMEDPRQTKLEDFARDQEVEVEHWLEKRVLELMKSGMTKEAARRVAEIEEDQKDAAHIPPTLER